MSAPPYVGPYPIRGVVGSGAMGMVYLAHDPAIDRPVAIKTIHRRLLESSEDDPSVVARFRVEAKAAGRLTHRNIVPVYQFGEDDDCAYIVMEYVCGRNLRDYIHSPPELDVPQVLCLMLQLLDGLHYAHERGIVHRDIKPANLLIADDGRLKITDFGIARTGSSNLTRASSVIGSPGYIAPEQYTDSDVDRRVDVFSAGVLLYQMLSGSTPFVGTDDAIMYKIVYEAHKPLSEATRNAALAPFDAVLDMALAKNPAQRYPTALAMRTALLALAPDGVPDVLPAEILLAPRLESLDAKSGLGKGRDSSSQSQSQSTLAAPAPDSTSMPVTPSRPQPGGGPPSVPVPTGWDTTALAEVERELAQHVGPVARVLVRRAARGLTSLSAVRHAVAGAIVDFNARERFLARAGPPRTRGDTTAPSAAPHSRAGPVGTTHSPTNRSHGSASPPSQSPPSQSPTAGSQVAGGGSEVPFGVPMREGDVDKAATALLASLGPIARIVAKRCAARSQTREQFIAHVVEQLAPGVDARRVQVDLWRALR